MKKTLIITVFSILLSFVLNGQTKPKAVFLHHKSVMDELKLTPEQRIQIIEIRKITDVKFIDNDPKLSAQEKQKAKTELYRKRREMQHEVLTAEQIKNLKRMQAEARKNN